MLTNCKETYRPVFNIVSAVIVLLLACSDPVYALAPKLSLTQPEFEEEYLASSLLLTDGSATRYALSNIHKGLERSDRNVLILGVKGFLKNIGQIAKIDIDNDTQEPVIYVDTNYFYNDDVINFEQEKITALERIRARKKYTYSEMAVWLKDHVNTSDRDIGGITSRQWADNVNKEASDKYPGVIRLYKRIKTKYSKAAAMGKNDRAASLLNFMSMYAFYIDAGGVTDREDSSVNFAAHVAESNDGWLDRHAPQLKGSTILSLSMEGNIPEFEGYVAQNANTKGGLGAYFGDKLEGMAAVGINALGAQPGYSHIRKDGVLVKVDYDELIEKGILKKVLTGDDAIVVNAWDEDQLARSSTSKDKSNPEVRVEVYQVNRGGATDYIFMSNVFDELYTSDRVHRFTQEIVFGKAVFEFMKKMALKPDILHLNEAHTVVAAAQMRTDDSFNKTAIVYTNHTLVPAGLETFPYWQVGSNINRMMYVIGLHGAVASKFRSMFLRDDGVVDFCYAATHLADVINAVSKEHAIATKKLFKQMYGVKFDAEVIGVLNGSGQSWKSDRLLELEATGNKPTVDDAWQIHEYCKALALKEVESRSGVKLDPAKPAVWAIRRLVEYKSQYPMLKYIVHLMTADTTRTFTKDELRDIWFRDIANFRRDYDANLFNTRDIAEATLNKLFPKGAESVHGLGMQVVVGWPGQPGGDTEFWAYEFYRWMGLPDLKGRFVALESDSKMLKMQAIGADSCLNCPRPLEEAAGTSDQRSALNFGVTTSLRGAGPGEYVEDYNEETETGSGFLIDSYTIETPDGLEPDLDRFYREAPGDIFEKFAISSRLFYMEGKSKWKRLMLNSYLRANETVTAVAMEHRYVMDVYRSALQSKAAVPPLAGVIGSPAVLLEIIKADGSLIKDATNKNKGICVKSVLGYRDISERRVQEEFRVLKDLGIFIPVKPGSSYVRFNDMMLGPDEEYTKNMINAVNDIRYMVGKRGDERPLHRGDIPADMIPDVRELVKMAIISEMEKEFTVPVGKVIYHLIEQDVIPVGQRSTLIQAMNNAFYRDNNGPERVLILNGGQTVTEMIAEIRAKDQNAVIDAALSDESHIGSISDAAVKKMVFKTERDFIQLDGVLKALRALHYESADETLSVLKRLYTVMSGMPPEGQLPAVSGVYIFNLPKIAREEINNIPRLNERLLMCLASA